MAIDVSGKKFIATIHAYQKMMERSILKEDVARYKPKESLRHASLKCPKPASAKKYPEIKP